MTNSTLYCVNVTNVGQPNCTITLISETITLSSSVLMASMINISAVHLEILEGSDLSANGTGLKAGPGTSSFGFSPSYGGRGGGNCLISQRHLTYGDQYDPRTFFGSGSDIKYCNGGGIITITTKNFTLKGVISASGNLPLNNSLIATVDPTLNISVTSCSAGGTGGTIFINITNFSEAEKGLILANGGNGTEQGYGGGGGRIAIYGKIGKVGRMKARGGTGGYKKCPIGGAGTIYLAEEDTVIVDNDLLATKNPTPITGKPTLSVRLEGQALLTPPYSQQSIILKSFSISNSRFDTSNVASSSDPFDSALNLTVLETLSLSNNAAIGSESIISLNLNVKKLTSEARTRIVFTSQFNLIVENAVLKGAIEWVSGMLDSSSIMVEAKGNFSLLSDGLIKASYVWIWANNMNIEGQITATQKTCYEHLSDSPSPPPFNLSSLTSSSIHSSNLTLALLSRSDLITEYNARIQGARICLLALNISLKGVVSASGFGCVSNLGPGKGFAVLRKYAGSGAGYGGRGGVAMKIPGVSGDDEDEIPLRGAEYSDWSNPWFEGSGGGSAVDAGGAGGGLIFVESLTSLTLAGIISSDGSDAYRHPLDLIAGSGGGSGGGIYISSKYITFNQTNILANGGRGSIHGGGGAGGRILFALNAEAINGTVVHLPNYITTWHLANVVVQGGSPGNYHIFNRTDRRGESGSIASRNCPPGTANYTCQACGAGRYKIGYDYVPQCEQCTNKPPNGVYIERGGTDALCTYVCPAGYTPVEINPDCESPLDEFFDLFGGVAPTIFFFTCCLILIALLPLGVSMLYQRYRVRSIIAPDNSMIYLEMQSRKLPNTQKENPELNKEDLPFQERRIFLLGENTYYRPWSLPKAPPPEIENIVVAEEYSNFATKINNKSRWYTYQYYLCVLFLWSYHPLGLYLLHRFRKCKYLNIRKFITKYNEALWRKIKDRQLGNSLRVTCSDDYTLAYFDIVDSSRKVVEWDERPNLPMHVLCSGDGSFWNPYHLDTKDLMIQLLAWRMDPEATDEYQVFLHLFNQLLRTVSLDTPQPDKKQPEILAIQRLVEKYNDELFHINDYHLLPVVFQAPMVVEEGKYVQVQWSGALNSKLMNTYTLDLVMVSSKYLYSFKPGLIVMRFQYAPEPRSPTFPLNPFAHHYFEPNGIAASDSVQEPSIRFVNDPIDSLEFSEWSLKKLLLVNSTWNQYMVMFGLLLAIFIDVVIGTQSISLRILTDSPLDQSTIKLEIFFGILPGANLVTPFLSLVPSTQLMPVVPSLIPAYISFQLASTLSTVPTFAYYLSQRPSWFTGLLMGLQIIAKVASLRLAAVHKANIESMAFFQVKGRQKRSKRPITPMASRS